MQSARFLFNGQQYDQTTRQYYLRARYYNPVIARFTQEDTYRGDGLNLYAYCANNPVSYVDPSGYAKKEYGRDHTTNLAHESHETVTAGEGRRAGDSLGDAVPKNKKLALGLREYLDEFARRNNAHTWKDFANPDNWKEGVNAALFNPEM